MHVTSIQQHGVAGGDAVAEKRIDFTYDADGQHATVTRYADLAGTELVATGRMGCVSWLGPPRAVTMNV